MEGIEYVEYTKRYVSFLYIFISLLSIEKYENQILVIEKAEFTVRRYEPPEVCITAFLI